MGRPEAPVNHANGFAVVLRAAPVGLLFDPDAAFDAAGRTAAVTHGHPDAVAAASAFAWLISALLEGRQLAEAAEALAVKLSRQDTGRGCWNSVRKALAALTGQTSAFSGSLFPGADTTAEACLAAGLHAALSAGNLFVDAMEGAAAAGNHAAGVAGSLFGVQFGAEAIPRTHRRALPLAEIVAETARDLLDVTQRHLKDPP
jgi:ADP-ribosylglycohydrolase